MRRSRRVGRVLVVGVVALGLALAGCSNASSGSKGGSTTGSGGTTANQPGVTKDTIRVGGVASVTNAINGPYGSIFNGVQAYFDMVNSSGGIYGRKLELVSKRDDQMVNNQQEVQGLLSQNNVFAVLPVATIISFSGAKILAQQNVPTFGWNINDEWAGPKNLFGHTGKQCFLCAHEDWAWIAKKLDRHKIAALAYNVANSTECVDGVVNTFKKYPVADVVYVNKSLTFGQADFSVEVRQMKADGVDFVWPCLDENATLNLAKEMRKQSMDAVQFLPNAYDHAFMEANGQFFENAVVGTQFTPFETRPKPPGLSEFDTWMAKAHYTPDEVAIIGWINADQFVTGLRATGKDLTRQKLIDAINKETDFTADGMTSGVNWTIAHTGYGPTDCGAYVRVHDSKFEPAFGKPGKAYICFPHVPATLPAEPTYK